MNTPHATPRTVLAIAGSLRRGSCNRRLLEAAARCVPAGMRLLPCDALATLPLFNEDLEQETAGGPKVVRRFRSQVAAADALCIATPEYNQSIPGVLKNALDWLSRAAPDAVLVGKPVALLGATQGRWGTRLAQSHLRHVLVATEALVLPQPMVFVREAERRFDAEGRLADEATREALRDFLAAFSRWIELVGGGVVQGGYQVRGT